jgi:glycosyltransferase involved in cell wall biosynthesis
VTVKLSVVVPVYNEALTVRQIVDAVDAVPLDIEIVIVDDFSTDGTRDILKNELFDAADKIIFHDTNQGKGAAVRSGFAAASGDAVVIQDADLEYDPQEFPAMLRLIEQDVADVVYGSRFLGGRPHEVVKFWHMIGNKILTTLSNMFTNLNLTDMETCYKMFRREVIESITIEENRFGIEPEITAKIAKGRWRVFEVPIGYKARTWSGGKKIGWRDGVSAIFAILKYNLRPQRR